MPRELSTATCAARILDAATIFMAFVILPMFLIARMRSLTAWLLAWRTLSMLHALSRGLAAKRDPSAAPVSCCTSDCATLLRDMLRVY